MGLSKQKTKQCLSLAFSIGLIFVCGCQKKSPAGKEPSVKEAKQAIELMAVAYGEQGNIAAQDKISLDEAFHCSISLCYMLHPSGRYSPLDDLEM